MTYTDRHRHGSFVALSVVALLATSTLAIATLSARPPRTAAGDSVPSSHPIGGTGGGIQVLVPQGDVLWAGWGARVVALNARERTRLPVLGASPILGGAVRGLALDGKTAVAAAGRDLAVLDLADPAAPRLVATLPFTGPLGSIALANGHAYVVTGEPGSHPFGVAGAVAVVDLRDQAHPVLVEPALQPANRRARDLVVAGRTLAVAVELLGLDGHPIAGDSALVAYDIADPAHPDFTGEIRDPAWRRLATGTTQDGRLAVFGYGRGGLAVDASSPHNVRIADRYGDDQAASLEPSGLAVLPGGRLLVARTGGYGSGVVVQPRRMGTSGEVAEAYRGNLVGDPAGGIAAIGSALVVADAGGRIFVFDAGSPAQEMSRLAEISTLGEIHGLTVAPEDPDILYATVRQGGFASLRRRPDPLAPRLTTIARDTAYYSGLNAGAGVAVAAYAGEFDTFGTACHAYDIHDPAQPRLAATLDGGCDAFGMARRGRLLFTGAFKDACFCMLEVADLADVSNPRVLASLSMPGSFDDLALDGNRLVVPHLPAWRPAPEKRPMHLATFDVTDPARPVLLADPVTMLLADEFGPSLRISLVGHHAFLLLDHLDETGAKHYSLVVMDLADPATPMEIARLPLGERFFGDIDTRGGHAYITVEDGVLVVDIRDPAAPRLVARLDGEPSLRQDTVVVVGDLVYVASGQAGILAYRPQLFPPLPSVTQPPPLPPSATPTAPPPDTPTPTPPPGRAWLPWAGG